MWVHVTAAEERASSLVWCMLVAMPGTDLEEGGQGSVRKVRQGRAHGTWSLERNMLTALMELENGTGCAHGSESLLCITDLLKHHGRDGCDVITAVL